MLDAENLLLLTGVGAMTYGAYVLWGFGVALLMFGALAFSLALIRTTISILGARTNGPS